MKKLTAILLTLAQALSLSAFASAEAKTTYTVGICNFVDDASLNQIVENIEAQLKEMEQRLATEKESDLTKHREEVCDMLKAEILTRYYYDEGRLEGALKTDPVVLRAVEEINKK